MARRVPRNPGPSPYESDPDAPDQSDIDRFSDVTTTCPKCQTTLYDDADICWNCGHNLLERDTSGPKPWTIATAIFLLLALAFFILRWWL